jgi:hypothetical protein
MDHSRHQEEDQDRNRREPREESHGDEHRAHHLGEEHEREADLRAEPDRIREPARALGRVRELGKTVAEEEKARRSDPEQEETDGRETVLVTHRRESSAWECARGATRRALRMPPFRGDA